MILVHPDEQCGIDRRPTGRTENGAKWLRTSDRSTKERPQQVGGGNMSLKRELVEQRRLIDLPLTRHRFNPHGK
jgi:hypothetical protein